MTESGENQPVSGVRFKIAYQLFKEALTHSNETTVISGTTGKVIERIRTPNAKTTIKAMASQLT